MNKLIETLDQIYNEIQINKQLSKEDLENLLLITYNEYIYQNSQNNYNIIKSYLDIIFYNYIKMKKESIHKENIISNLIHSQIQVSNE